MPKDLTTPGILRDVLPFDTTRNAIPCSLVEPHESFVHLGDGDAVLPACKPAVQVGKASNRHSQHLFERGLAYLPHTFQSDSHMKMPMHAVALAAFWIR